MKYREKYNTKAVKKTLTIPQWMNEAAAKANINFSQVLQDALREKLSV
ncbi:MAG TPA: toxin-antitoxin system, antitoxin component, HicB domain protein [Lachnospiraceae bacterium]|nr:toxin-antitoxin system, antitoxin component, HicB domain protein [Lachnospiraceae bacterium]